LLAAMGMQPRVIAEPCDITQHESSAWARSDEDERLTLGVPAAWRDGDVDLAAVLAPETSETPPRLYHLLPVLELLRLRDFVLVGRVAMRMHGLGCSVPRVDVIADAAPAPALWSELSDRLHDGSLAVWSPEAGRYCWTPSAQMLAEIAAWTTTTQPLRSTLALRTANTATEVRLQIRPGPLPSHVMGGTVETPVPLLAISELARSDDPEVGRAFDRLVARGSR
jgi:hypothetical protein